MLNAPLSGPMSSLMGQQQSMQEPFIWGQGGQRVTPEELAQQQSVAQALMQSDYSPVQSWTQGLGRVADNLLGAFQAKNLKKEAFQQRHAMDEVIRNAVGPGNQDIAALILSGDKAAAGLADNLYAARTPKQAAPTEYERALAASGVLPGTPEWTQRMGMRASTFDDPFTSFTVGNQFYAGQRSDVQRALEAQQAGGGGQVSSGAGVPMGSPLASGDPIAVVDVVQHGGKTYYKFADGKVFDNPERR